VSYDIRFGVKVAGAPNDCYAVIGQPEYDSPTYNLRAIFQNSMDWDYRQGEWYPIKDVLPKMRKGIETLHKEAWKYKQLEPSNGWGTIGSAIQAMQSVLDYFDPTCWGGLDGSWNAGIPLDCIYMSW